ncbi:hypothetical protein DFQ11_103160 [Winogradskyella epiphytica]|uniref:Uncharacterized protein n=1 Tax=Winogradskyella epiphytica TaxID=262005 RepID=A0A2V4WVU6_9FLAO|nr:hypothetical protein [Winogradskyella epiphytica]PYE81080.1 hypothetical protein DFQ11_103160 [Winogradskyella epiphytica]GGW66718.1 hypothetical protein GCM10008085_18230 [Winogradskyella epiphytica]
MNIKRFIVAGAIGGLIHFFLSWFCYGILLIDYFPPKNETTRTIILVFLAFFSVGFFISYFFNRWAHITTASMGLRAGIFFGLFLGLLSGFFYLAIQYLESIEVFFLHLAASIVTAACTGAVVGGLSGRIS